MQALDERAIRVQSYVRRAIIDSVKDTRAKNQQPNTYQRRKLGELDVGPDFGRRCAVVGPSTLRPVARARRVIARPEDTQTKIRDDHC